jgi:hypothetical protein
MSEGASHEGGAPAGPGAAATGAARSVVIDPAPPRGDGAPEDLGTVLLAVADRMDALLRTPPRADDASRRADAVAAWARALESGSVLGEEAALRRQRALATTLYRLRRDGRVDRVAGGRPATAPQAPRPPAEPSTRAPAPPAPAAPPAAGASARSEPSARAATPLGSDRSSSSDAAWSPDRPAADARLSSLRLRLARRRARRPGPPRAAWRVGVALSLLSIVVLVAAIVAGWRG